MMCESRTILLTGPRHGIPHCSMPMHVADFSLGDPGSIVLGTNTGPIDMLVLELAETETGTRLPEAFDEIVTADRQDPPGRILTVPAHSPPSGSS